MHLYLGVFIAPMLLFFAITGGLQTFGLHEGGRGSSYKPPAWLATMAQLHKKQTVVMPSAGRVPSSLRYGASERAGAGAVADSVSGRGDRHADASREICGR